MSDLPGLDEWIMRLPAEPPCDCGEEECEECAAREETELRYWKMIDDKIDEARGK